jgi:hypothetical protein
MMVGNKAIYYHFSCEVSRIYKGAFEEKRVVNKSAAGHITFCSRRDFKGYQLKAEECGTPRRTLPLNFSAFSGKPF